MKRLDKLNGLKSWWNRLCKPEYKLTQKADEVKSMFISEYEITGDVEMSRMYAKDNSTHIFWR